MFAYINDICQKLVVWPDRIVNIYTTFEYRNSQGDNPLWLSSILAFYTFVCDTNGIVIAPIVYRIVMAHHKFITMTKIFISFGGL